MNFEKGNLRVEGGERLTVPPPSGEEMAACWPSLAPPWFVPLILFQNGDIEKIIDLWYDLFC